MRISNNTMIERAMRDINANKARMANVQRDITTGKRIHRGSDDPTTAARAAALRQQSAVNATYAENVDRATDYLMNTDAALTKLNDVLVRVRNVALQGASGQPVQAAVTVHGEDGPLCEATAVHPKAHVALNLAMAQLQTRLGVRPEVTPLYWTQPSLAYDASSRAFAR